VSARRFDLPGDREVRLRADGRVDLEAVETAALARRDCRAVTPARVGIGEALALRAVLGKVALAVRVRGQVARVDGEVAAEVGVLPMEAVEDASDAGVEQIGVGAELGGEAVGGVDGRALAADG
jgi:hypothetical protein